jgi:hypothetical protein
MKIFGLIVSIFIQTICIYSQSWPSNDDILNYFQEIKENTAQHIELWDIDLYGPILIVDQNTRFAFANFADDEGVLKEQGGIFTGYLPERLNIANTAIDWNGRRWAMIVLPLHENKQDRLEWISHELFHRSQPVLGFEVRNPDNNHLDEKDGRVYLRLEIEALEQALQSKNRDQTLRHLTHALIFRKYRNKLFPGSAHNENLLELNEGIATYTGIIMSGRNMMEIEEHFMQFIKNFHQFPTFVRSFAYLTTPIYGYLLNQTEKFWNKEIYNDTNLTEYFISSFNISLPNDPDNTVQEIFSIYGGNRIENEENKREEDIKLKTAEYKARFIENPHLEITLENMSISFDALNIFPLDGFGSVYPTLRLTDNWGILTVTNGALLGSNWDKITVCKPLEIGKDKVTGNGWCVEIEQDYEVIKNKSNDNYTLRRKHK